MKTAIKKKVAEYRSKIKDCDRKLRFIKCDKAALHKQRRGHNETEAREAEFQFDAVRRDESTIDTQRQCYVQAMHDFDSLLDEL